jgi:Hemerythrin HHE cation binding domain
MARRHRVEYLRKEHQGLLDLADRIEEAIALACHKEFTDHEKSLAELRSLEHGFSGIVEHCHAEDRIVESTLYHYVGEAERSRMDEEHSEIVRTLGEFREELRFATVDRTKEMIVSGRELLGKLRAHVANEAALLDRIAGQSARDGKRKPAKKPRHARRAARTNRTRTTRTQSGEERPNIPYTLEPHPEL